MACCNKFLESEADMDLKLTDKVALVTGTGSQIGYGKGIAMALAQEGCNIISADIDLEGARKTAAEVEASRRKSLAVKVDVRNRDDVDDMIKKWLAEFGRIDILINNAGVSSRWKPFVEMTREDWDYDIGVNLYGQMNVAHAVLPHMISRKCGRIINTSGGQGIPGISMYGAAKGAVVQWTRALAREVATFGIIVSVYSPGLGATGLTAHDPRDMENMVKSLPMARFCTPEDVGPLVAFMASELSNYFAGSFGGGGGI
jgi:NAD(P)-dependent dehydrogenase (short-subunit alcohol dehydrogenase family)